MSSRRTRDRARSATGDNGRLRQYLSKSTDLSQTSGSVVPAGLAQVISGPPVVSLGRDGQHHGVRQEPPADTK